VWATLSLRAVFRNGKRALSLFLRLGLGVLQLRELYVSHLDIPLWYLSLV